TPTRTAPPTRTSTPTPTLTPTITGTPTPDLVAHMIADEKDAVTSHNWKIAEYLAGQLNMSLAPAEARRADLVAWLADQADNLLLYVDPPSEPDYRPSIAGLCDSWRISGYALTLGSSNRKAATI